MATAGVSAERTVVSGVLLSRASTDGASPTVLRTAERDIEDGATVETVVTVLGEVAAASDDDVEIEDVAVAYRSPGQRREILTALADGPWRAASLVSTRSALAAYVAHLPEVAGHATVLVLEAADFHTTCAVVGKARAHAPAGDSWQTVVADDEHIERTVARVRSVLTAVDATPDAVVLCGSAAGDAKLEEALRSAFAVPIVHPPDPGSAVAQGAALAAAATARAPLTIPPARRGARPLLVAAAAALILGAAGFAAAQVFDRGSDTAQQQPAPQGRAEPIASSAAPSPAEVPSPAGTPPPAEVPPPPAELPPPPAEVPPPPPDPTAEAAEQASPPAPAVVPQRPVPPRVQPPSPEPEPEAPPAPDAPPAPAAPIAPNPDGLFPGEGPPPPADADPEVQRRWWENHITLKQRWLNGG